MDPWLIHDWRNMNVKVDRQSTATVANFFFLLALAFCFFPSCRVRAGMARQTFLWIRFALLEARTLEHILWVGLINFARGWPKWGLVCTKHTHFDNITQTSGSGKKTHTPRTNHIYLDVSPAPPVKILELSRRGGASTPFNSIIIRSVWAHTFCYRRHKDLTKARVSWRVSTGLR